MDSLDDNPELYMTCNKAMVAMRDKTASLD